MVLGNKSMTNITRCVDSADKSNLSRFGSEARWFQEQVNRRRIGYLLQASKSVRKGKADSALAIDFTLCAHVETCSSVWHATIITAKAPTH